MNPRKMFKIIRQKEVSQIVITVEPLITGTLINGHLQ
jgi:hypothetical protein